MLYGEYIQNLGEKNRVAIPKKVREQLEGPLYLTKGLESHLILVDSNRWENLLKHINKSKFFAQNTLDAKRFLIGGSLEIETDKQGRFVVPEYHRNHSNFRDQIVFVGIGEWVELWSLEDWQEKSNTINKNLNNIFDNLND